MRMKDWHAYRREVSAGIHELGRLSRDTVRGYVSMSRAGRKTAQLDDKIRELVAIAVASALRCDGCLTVHAESARRYGATKGEIAEAMGVAIGVSAGAAIIFATRTLDAFDASGELLALTEK